jgi:hypothetical protein
MSLRASIVILLIHPLTEPPLEKSRYAPKTAGLARFT